MLVGVIAEETLIPSAVVASFIVREPAAAADVVNVGFVFPALLVDDPASASEQIDAYLGEVMVEAANAADAFDAGLTYNAAIVEAVTSTSAQDGTVTSAPTATTWNPSDKSANIVLSNANLTLVANTTAAGGVRTIKSVSTGQLYYEVTWNNTTNNSSAGFLRSSDSLTTNVTAPRAGVINAGNVWINGAFAGVILGAFTAGDVACFAIDLGNARLWIRKNGGNWNNSGTANPTTNTGGLDISVAFPGSPALYPYAGISTSTAPQITANFGATAFAQTVPSGFVAWG